MIAYNNLGCGTYADSSDKCIIVTNSASNRDETATTSNPCMYIVADDFYIDPNEYTGTEPHIKISDTLIETPVQFWPDLYLEEPQKCLACFESAPLKLEYKTNARRFIHKILKQPVSKTGFKRGQRR